MRAGGTALFFALIMMLFAAPRAEASIFDRDEDYGRVVQSMNLGLSDQVFAMPHPSLIDEDPAAAHAAIVAWTHEANAALAAQVRRSAEVADPPRSRNRDRRAAMQAQAQSMSRFMAAFRLMLDGVGYFAASGPQTLRDQRAWYADAFYDARTLALRVQNDLAMAQAILADDPLVSASLLVLAHSTDIQLELTRAAHNRAHGALLNSTDMAARLARSAQAMEVALAQARAELAASHNEQAIAWQDCLDHEAMIANAAQLLSNNLRGGGDRGFAGQGSEIDRVLALYRDRPSRTISFAMTFTL
jgi:hypothetical protein